MKNKILIATKVLNSQINIAQVHIMNRIRQIRLILLQ